MASAPDTRQTTCRSPTHKQGRKIIPPARGRAAPRPTTLEVQIDTRRTSRVIVENKKIDWEHQRGHAAVALETLDGPLQKPCLVDQVSRSRWPSPHPARATCSTHAGRGRAPSIRRPHSGAADPAQGDKPHSLRDRVPAILCGCWHDTRSHTLAGFSRRDSAGVLRRGHKDFAERPAVAEREAPARTSTAPTPRRSTSAIQSHPRSWHPPSTASRPSARRRSSNGLYNADQG